MPGPVWRTDMFKSVLADERLKEAEFICAEGPTIIVPADDLRTVLPLGHDHYGSQIWGPFSIDPLGKTIDGRSVNMIIDGDRERSQAAGVQDHAFA